MRDRARWCINNETVLMGVSDLDGSTYLWIKGAIHYAITFVKLCYDKTILPEALILSSFSMNAFYCM